MAKPLPGYPGNRRGYFGAAQSHASDHALMEGLYTEPVEVVEKPTSTTDDGIAINDLEYVGSYSWVEARKPTVVVPGSPAYWRDRPLPYLVPLDTKDQFVDQAGERMGSLTLHPLIRAVDLESEEQGEEFDWSTVDFVTDRNSIRKLLSWIQADDRKAQPFRIDTQLAGKGTVLLNRWEKRTKEASGHWPINFQRESTYRAPGYENIPTVSHHRIVKYDFGGLNMVVRFSVDACIPPTGVSTPAPQRPPASADVDNLSSMLSSMGVASSVLKIDGDASTAELDVIRATISVVPQSSLIEITTRSERNAARYNWADTYPQLYFSQTQHRFLAVHNQGNFTEVRKRALDDPEMKRIEARLQSDFKKLGYALQAIQDLVVEHGERGRLSLVFEDNILRVFGRKTQESCLPDTTLRRFEGL